MSIQAVGWVLEHEHTTSGAERLVLLSLANHAGWRGDQWECYPSLDLIASEAGIHRRETVKDALARLIERGLITRIVNAAPDSRIPANRRPNLYVLHLSPGGTESAPAEPLGGADTAARGGGLRALGGADTAPQTIIEPSVEPTPARDPFEEFWQAYPRKVDKDDARVAYRRAVKRAAPDVILAGLVVWARSWNDAKTEKRFIPHAARWLNMNRWTSEPDTLAAPALPLPAPRQVCARCHRYTQPLIECPDVADDCPVTFGATLEESVGKHPASGAN